MALKAKIYKVNLSVANLNLHHYQDYRFTLAQHPSETNHRMIIRLAAFALFAHENPEFTQGLCVDEEPELWTHNLTREIQHWIELGQPSEKRLRQACSKAEKVTILGYHAVKFKKWIDHLEQKTQNSEKIQILFFEPTGPIPPQDLVAKTMSLNCTIQEEQLLLSSDQGQMSWEVSSPSKR